MLEIHKSLANTPMVNLVGSSSHHNVESILSQSGIISSPFAISSFKHNSSLIPWIIDPGAIDHMVCSIQFFQSLSVATSMFVTLPTSLEVPVIHICSIKLSDSLILNNVLCIPSFSFNFLSASMLVNSNACPLIFFAQFYFIQDLCQWKMIGLGKEKDGLYYLLSPLTSSNKVVSSFFVNTASVNTTHVNTTCFDLWHCCLGHISNTRQSLLHKQCHSIKFSHSNCDVCHYFNELICLFLLVLYLPLVHLKLFIVTFGVLFHTNFERFSLFFHYSRLFHKNHLDFPSKLNQMLILSCLPLFL